MVNCGVGHWGATVRRVQAASFEDKTDIRFKRLGSTVAEPAVPRSLRQEVEFRRPATVIEGLTRGSGHGLTLAPQLISSGQA